VASLPILAIGLALADAALGAADSNPTAPDLPEPGSVEAIARDEHELQGRPAILAVPRGEGMIVAYNFNPMHRDLNRPDHRLLWNGILNWQSVRRWRAESSEK
jgi:hypothetical protein